MAHPPNLRQPLNEPCFYLGTHEPSWLTTAGVPLCVAHQRLASRITLPRARAGWFLDSGAYQQLTLRSRWDIPAADYVAAVRRYDQEIGQLEWAASQDWPCEDEALTATSLPVWKHQGLTVENFTLLQQLWGDHDTSPFMPVLQGRTPADYVNCMRLYEQAGVNLRLFPVVGLGSVCRRQRTTELGEIIGAVRAVDPGIPLHGFGVKQTGLRRYGHRLESADSLAWSYDAYRRGRPLPGCTHQTCANCLRYALAWRERVITRIHPDDSWNEALFELPA